MSTASWIRQIPPLAVHRLHADGHRQLRRHVTGDAARAGSTYSPLLPLALLLFTGLYMFVLPYVSRRRSKHDGQQEA